MPELRHKSDWPLPLLHRRWGPLNRGAVRFREVADAVLFGGRPGGLDVGSDGSIVVRDAISAGRGISNGQRGAIRPGHFYKGFDKGADKVYRNLTSLGINIVSVARYDAPGGGGGGGGSKGGKAGGNSSIAVAATAATPKQPLTIYWTDASLWFLAMDAQVREKYRVLC